MAWVEDNLRVELLDLFLKVMSLYGKHDFLSISNYVVDTLAKRQIDNFVDLKNRGLEEVIDKVRIYSILDSAYIDNVKHQALIRFRTTFERYIVNKDNGEVVDGIRDYVGNFIYEVLFTKNDSIKEGTCRYCGAELKDSDLKCEYCGVVNINKNSNWLIQDIKEIAS